MGLPVRNGKQCNTFFLALEVRQACLNMVPEKKGSYGIPSCLPATNHFAIAPKRALPGIQASTHSFKNLYGAHRMYQ